MECLGTGTWGRQKIVGRGSTYRAAKSGEGAHFCGGGAASATAPARAGVGFLGEFCTGFWILVGWVYLVHFLRFLETFMFINVYKCFLCFTKLLANAYPSYPTRDIG